MIKMDEETMCYGLNVKKNNKEHTF